MKIGFLGLGRMGQGMCARLLGGGHDLLVYNRTAGKAADLEKAGAKVATSIASACKDRDLVISMVADDNALFEVAVGPGGVSQFLPKDAVHVSMGTHSAGAIQVVAASSVFRPIRLKAGSHFLRASAGPAATMTSCPAAAASGRPSTGAATNARPLSL